MVPLLTSERYPTPGDPTTSGVAKYNLDPLVWLIHEASNWPPGDNPVVAYAFSVDDGIGNITVNGVDDFQVTVGGVNGLNNPKTLGQPV
jgi:hypothetical protein